MATTTKIQLNFAKENGNSMSLSFANARMDVSNANIKTLGQTIVTNGAIYENVPVALRSAQIITTDTTDVDLS